MYNKHNSNNKYNTDDKNEKLVIGLMQNNHVVSSIAFLCLYLANSNNLTHYNIVVIRLHFWIQNKHVVSSIEFSTVLIPGQQ